MVCYRQTIDVLEDFSGRQILAGDSSRGMVPESRHWKPARGFLLYVTYGRTADRHDAKVSVSSTFNISHRKKTCAAKDSRDGPTILNPIRLKA